MLDNVSVLVASAADSASHLRDVLLEEVRDRGAAFPMTVIPAGSNASLEVAWLPDGTSIVVGESTTYPMLQVAPDLRLAGRPASLFTPTLVPSAAPRGAFGVPTPVAVEDPREADLHASVRRLRRLLGKTWIRVSSRGPGRVAVMRALFDSGLVAATPIALATRGRVSLQHSAARTGWEVRPAAELPTGLVLLFWNPRRPAYRSQPTVSQLEALARADRDQGDALTASVLAQTGVLLSVIADPGTLNGRSPSMSAIGGGEPLEPGEYRLMAVDSEHRWREVGRGADLRASHHAELAERAEHAHRRWALLDDVESLVALGPLPPAPPAVLHAEPAAGRELAVAQAKLEQAERSLRAARREAAALSREVERLTELATPGGGMPAPALSTDEPVSVSSLAYPLPAVPSDLSSPAAALVAAQNLDHVVVTEHARDQALALSRDRKAAVWGARCWGILVDLERYAGSRASHEGIPNFRAYLSRLDDPSISAAQVAIRESDTVMNAEKMRQERIRPVPVEVDESGSALFVEHVRVESGGAGLAPRLYFYDDTSGKTGKVIVGYVGPHLTNAST